MTEAAPGLRRRSTPSPSGPRKALLVLGVLLVLVLACLLSLFLGSRLLSPWTVLQGLFGQLDPASPEGVVVSNRVLRTVIGLVVGACLAVAGAALQGVTRNPLGDPGVLGINAGATAAVVAGVTWWGISSTTQYAAMALVGSLVAAVVVYAIASIGAGGATPIKLALVGAAFSAGMVSVVSALNLSAQATLDAVRRWQVGSLTRVDYPDILTLVPVVLVGLALTVGFASSVNAFALGDDMARALGEKVALKRAVVFLGTTLLCAAAMALAGPISFLGLMAPHILRSLFGPDYRYILPVSALGGPAILLVADSVGRVLDPGREIQVGVTMAVVGAPVFIAMIRSRKAIDL